MYDISFYLVVLLFRLSFMLFEDGNGLAVSFGVFGSNVWLKLNQLDTLKFDFWLEQS